MPTYAFDWGGHYPLFMVEPSIKRHLLVTRFLGEQAKTDTFTFSEHGVTESYTREKDAELLDKTSKKFLDPPFTKQLFLESANIRKAYTKKRNLLEKTDPQKLEDGKLINQYKQLNQAITQLLLYYELTRPEYQNVIEEQFVNAANKAGFAAHLMNELLSATELDEVQKEQQAWMLFCAKNNITDAVLLDYAKKNHWIFPGSKSEEELLAYAKKRHAKTEKQSLENIQEKIATEQEEFRQRKQLQKKHFSRHPKLGRLALLFQELGLERFRLKTCWVDAWNRKHLLLQEISKRKNIPHEELSSTYLVKDVHALHHKERALTQEETTKRATYVMRYLNNTIQFLTGQEAKTFIASIKQDQKQQVITGRTAYPGNATGKVVIVPNADIATIVQAGKHFSQGDILVTTMTQPSMVPLIKKAGAILCDEGGITSHAAILAREFKIPCLVGCKSAMKQFKNGDIIKVDAKKRKVKKQHGGERTK